MTILTRDIASAAAPAFDLAKLDTSTPVMVLGGKENSLSIVRHLGRLGIAVSCSGPANSWGMYSRYCAARHPLAADRDAKAQWYELLLGEDAAQPDGQIVLPCSDEAIEFVADHHDALAARYRIEPASPRQRRALLDKQETLEMARQAGVGTPRFWKIAGTDDLAAIGDQIAFPVMVKPLNSAQFTKVFGCKLFIVESGHDELARRVAQAIGANQPVMVVEMIPGPDSLLSSYYTYMSEAGTPQFHFTKRIWRRYPTNRGGATFHSTKWLPETAEAGLRFFRKTGFTGLGNIEFKRDTRDGKLKVIEVNARFTAAQELALRAGMPIDLIVYCQLTGQPAPAPTTFTEGLNYLYVLRDTLAFWELRRRGELTLRQWIASITPSRPVSPLHDIDDMAPSLKAGMVVANKVLR